MTIDLATIAAELDLSEAYDYDGVVLSSTADDYSLERLAEVVYLLQRGHTIIGSFVDRTERPYNEDIIPDRNLYGSPPDITGCIPVADIATVHDCDDALRGFTAPWWVLDPEWVREENDPWAEVRAVAGPAVAAVIEEVESSQSSKTERWGAVFILTASDSGTVRGSIRVITREKLGRYQPFKDVRNHLAGLIQSPFAVFTQEIQKSVRDGIAILARDEALVGLASLVAADDTPLAARRAVNGPAPAVTAQPAEDAPLVPRRKVVAHTLQQQLDVSGEEPALVSRRK